MQKLVTTMAIAAGVVIALLNFPRPAHAGCPVNMTEVGHGCMYTYEATIWSLPPTGNRPHPQAVQYGVDEDDYPCDDNGNDCTNIFAASLPGQLPSRFATWFQFANACANSGGMLPSNGMWQVAAAGTPTIECNVGSADTEPTGSNAGCVSNRGLLDMVGNVWEWTNDWAQSLGGGEGNSLANGNYDNDRINGISQQNVNVYGGGGSAFPMAWIRGGGFNQAAGPAGVFALFGRVSPAVGGCSQSVEDCPDGDDKVVADIGGRCVQ